MLSKALITTLLLMTPAPSQAASVTQVKGTKILLELEDEQELTPNQEVFIIDENGKRIGLVKIRQVRGGKAIGEVTKGRAVVGGISQPRSNPGSAQKAAPARSRNERSSDESEDTSVSSKKKLSGGFLLGYGSNSMSFTAQRTSPNVSANVNFKGTTIGLKVLRIITGRSPFPSVLPRLTSPSKSKGLLKVAARTFALRIHPTVK